MPRPFDPLGRKERARLLAKYAETNSSGTPIRCRPTNHPSTDGRQDKIVFRTERKAVAFAQAMLERVYESTKQYPYLCDRTTREHPLGLHWHLTTRQKSASERRQMRTLFEELSRATPRVPGTPNHTRYAKDSN